MFNAPSFVYVLMHTQTHSFFGPTLESIEIENSVSEPQPDTHTHKQEIVHEAL